MRVLRAALGGGIAALVVAAGGACSSTAAPDALAPARGEASAAAPATFDALADRAESAFERDGDAYVARGRSTTRVGPDGAIHFAPSTGLPAALELVTRGRAVAVRSSPDAGDVVVVDRGDHEERVTSRGGSAEQSWTFRARPASPVALRVAARGMRWVGETASGHHFTDDATGVGVRYGRATWVDASGRRTEVPVARDGGDLVLRVPDEAAAGPYPAVLDPTLSPEVGVDAPIAGPSGAVGVTASAPGPSGSSLVTWVDTNDGFYRALRVGANGQPIGGAVRLGYLGRFPSALAAAWDDVGQRWMVAGVSAGVLKFSRVAADGTVLDAAPKVILSSAATSVALAFDGAAFFVAYGATTSGTTSLKTLRVASATGSFDVASALAIGSPATSPRVACGLAAAGCAVAWAGASSTLLARVSSANAVLDPSGIPLAFANVGPGGLASDGAAWLATWSELGSPPKLKAARVAADGTVSPAVDVDAGSSLQPGSLTWNGAAFVALYKTGSSSSTVLRAKRVAPDGSVLDATSVVVESGVGHIGSWALASSAGQELMTWTRALGSPTPLYGRPYSSALAPLAAATPLTLGSNGQSRPAAAWNGSSYLVVWTDAREAPAAASLYMARLSSSGAPLDAQATKLGAGANPSVASDGNDFLVSWSSGGQLLASRVAKSAAALVDAPPLVVSTSLVTFAGQSSTFDGAQYVLTWSSNKNSALTGRDVFAARVTPEGALLDPDGFAVTSASGPQEGSFIGSDGNMAFVVWTDYRADYYNGDLFGARISRAGAPLDPLGIPIWKGAQGQYPIGVVGGAAGFTVFWQDNGRNSNEVDLLAARVSATGAVLDPIPTTVLQGVDFEAAGAVDMKDGVSKLVAVQATSTTTGSSIVGTFVRDAPGLEVLDAVPLPLADPAGATKSPAFAGGPPGTVALLYERVEPDGTQRVRFRQISSGAAAGAACAGAIDCKTRYCRDAVCCAETCDGACRRCGTGGACEVVRSADDPDTCTGENTCNADGACKKKSGSVCATPSECASGFCVDSLCCNTACDGACDTCAETRGACTPLARGALGTPSCSPNRCDGASSACATTCVSDADCADGYGCDRPTKTCIAGAVCVDGQTSRETSGALQTCAPYACRGGKCAETCGAVVDCAFPAACDESGRCVAAPTVAAAGCSAAKGTRQPATSPWAARFGALAALALAISRRLRRERR